MGSGRRIVSISGGIGVAVGVGLGVKVRVGWGDGVSVGASVGSAAEDEQAARNVREKQSRIQSLFSIARPP